MPERLAEIIKEMEALISEAKALTETEQSTEGMTDTQTPPPGGGTPLEAFLGG